MACDFSVGASGDIATQTPSDLQPRVENHQGQSGVAIPLSPQVSSKRALKARPEASKQPEKSPPSGAFGAKHLKMTNITTTKTTVNRSIWMMSIH